MPAYSFYMDACSRGRRAMKLPTDRTAVASIKRSNHWPKIEEFKWFDYLGTLDWTMNLPEANCDRRYEDYIFQIIYLFMLACAATMPKF
jgi:hypothetical protein